MPTVGEGASSGFTGSLPLSRGAQGVSLSMLRPSGKARFADRVVDVITQGEFIPPGTPVSVIASDGMRVVVESAARG